MDWKSDSLKEAYQILWLLWFIPLDLYSQLFCALPVQADPTQLT